MNANVASSFFEELLRSKEGKPLAAKALRDHEAIMALFHAAPGQDLETAKETVWGAANAVSYYVDHIRAATAGDRLDSAWFGSGCALKDKAIAEASLLL